MNTSIELRSSILERIRETINCKKSKVAKGLGDLKLLEATPAINETNEAEHPETIRSLSGNKK